MGKRVEGNGYLIELYFDSTEEVKALGNVETALLYSRVSTKHTEQETSLEAQDEENQRVCERNGYVVIGRFMEQETAKDDMSRKGYPILKEALVTFHPSYLIAKCQDRINRSVELNSQLLSICSETNTKIYNTMSSEIIDPNNYNDVLRSNINAIFDERYSLMQHEKGVVAHKRKCENKKLNRNNEIFGYRYNKVTNQMEVYEPEAVLVREMFRLYVFTDMGSTSIAKYFAEKGVTGRGTNKYVSEAAILKWLHTTAYIGQMSFNHKGTEFRHGSGKHSRRYNRDKSEWVYVDVPPIISEDLFDLAQKKLEESSKRFKDTHNASDAGTGFKGKHIFASKIICGSCGSPFLFKYSDRKKEIGSYRCSERKRVVRKSNDDSPIDLKCRSEYKKIRETTLQQVVKDSMDIYSGDVEAIFDNLYKLISEAIIETKPAMNRNASGLKETIRLLTKEKDALETAFVEASIPALRSSIESKYVQKLKEIEHYEGLLSEEKKKMNKCVEKKQEIEAVKEKLDEMKNVTEITRDVVQRYIDRIIVNEDGILDIMFHFNKTRRVAVPQEQPSSISISSVENIPTKVMTDPYPQDTGIRPKT